MTRLVLPLLALVLAGCARPCDPSHPSPASADVAFGSGLAAPQAAEVLRGTGWNASAVDYRTAVGHRDVGSERLSASILWESSTLTRLGVGSPWLARDAEDARRLLEPYVEPLRARLAALLGQPTLQAYRGGPGC